MEAVMGHMGGCLASCGGSAHLRLDLKDEQALAG